MILTGFIDGYAGILGKAKHAVDFAHCGAGIIQHGVREDDDYVGTWEDAFLFNGYENGKYSFLTSIICSIIARHGFDVKNLSHGLQHLANPSLGNNNIICRLGWKGESCIPSTDINGDTVVLGLTDPRLYLPKVVQDILDLEFGYTKEVVGAERITLKHDIIP